MSPVTSPIAYAARCGATRGRIEFGNSLRSGQDIGYYIVTSIILVLVLCLNRDNTVAGTDCSVAWFMLPGVLALAVFISGAFGIATVLATEREDGTLLRLKSVPYGIVGYVAGQTVRVTLEIAFSIVLMLVPRAVLRPGAARPTGSAASLGAVGYIAARAYRRAAARLRHRLGLPQPALRRRLGHARASVAPSGCPASFTRWPPMATWVQVVGQLLPTYWLGLGLRSALLPEAAAAVEIDGSWRTLLTIGVLLAWAIVGARCWRRCCCAGWPGGSPGPRSPPGARRHCSVSDSDG